jgi:predicted site-specific integrase-resolvase
MPTMTTEPEQLWRVSAVARRLDVTPGQMRKWIAAGLVAKVVRLPSGQYRIPESGVLDLMRKV